MRAPTEEEPLILVRTATENIVLGMKLGASRAEFARREAEEARVAREAERAEEVEERRREEGREQSRVAAEARVAREAEADQRWQEMQSAREVFESYVETDMVRYLREEEKPGADATNYFKRELHNLETRKRLEPGGSIPLSRLVYLAYEANKSGKRRPDGGVGAASPMSAGVLLDVLGRRVAPEQCHAEGLLGIRHRRQLRPVAPQVGTI